MQRKIFILMLTCLFFATSIFAQDPVVLRIGWVGSPDSLNMGIAVLSESFTIGELVYDSLYQLNLDGTYSLEAAESVEVSEDGLVYTYTLREGMKFHDGETMDSSDVVFSFNLYQTAPFVYQPSYTGYFANIEAPDERTVVLTLTDPIPNIESQLVFLYILPEHIWAEHEGDAAADFDNASLIGSGPFKLLEYSQNEFVRLGAVKDHYLNVANIDEVIFQTFANQDALVQALRTGQVDLITEMPNTAVIGLRDEENIEVVMGPPAAPSVTDIILNVLDPANCPAEDGICSGHAALLDRNVRLAMAHAIDKQQIIDVVLLGLGAVGTTLIPDSLTGWYNTDIVDYAFDPTLANQILDDAGYADVDGDGIREMPDGTNPLNFRINWPSDSLSAPRIAEMLSEQWGQIGIGLQLQALDADALTAVCCPAFDYDIIIWGWGSDPDPSFLLSVMITDEIPTGLSETGYSNPEYDELYVQQQLERDLQTRIDMVWQMQQIVHEDLPYIIPYYALEVQAYRSDRFQGWIVDAGKIELENLRSLLTITPVQ
jgi:peptide/nickel transport system substrate-binding protein